MSGERLGYKEQGKNTRWPTQYVDESEFDRGQDPAPNRIEIIKGWFCLLPPGQPTFLPFLTREALLKEIEIEKEKMADSETPKTKSVPDGVVDPDEPPPPEVEPVATTLPRRRNQS